MNSFIPLPASSRPGEKSRNKPSLSPRQTALIRHIWTLSPEEQSWLDHYFLVQGTYGQLAKLEITARNSILPTRSSFCTLFYSDNPSFYKSESIILLSVRINRESNLFIALVKEQKELSSHIKEKATSLSDFWQEW